MESSSGPGVASVAMGATRTREAALDEMPRSCPARLGDAETSPRLLPGENTDQTLSPRVGHITSSS
jgi:hypothetical protein